MPECILKDSCPYLDNRSCAEVLAENEYWQKRVLYMQEIMKQAEEKILNLEAEKKELLEEQKSLEDELSQAYQKPFKSNLNKNDNEKIRKKRGAPIGHRGITRKKPQKIDEYIDVGLDRCPECGCEELSLCKEVEEHTVEDIEIKKAKTTCYRKYHYYCHKCKKVVSVKDANEISKSYIGPVARAVGSHIRFGIGVPFDKVNKIFNDLFRLELSPASLVDFETKLAENGKPIYEQIKQLIRQSPFSYNDETGWRVDGNNCWLWNSTTSDAVLYEINPSRSGDVIKEILGENYQGIPVSDFYSAYNKKLKAPAKQKCVTHLLRMIKYIEDKKLLNIDSQDWIFCQTLKTIFKSAIDTHTRYKTGEITVDELKQSKETIAEKLTGLVVHNPEHKKVRNLRNLIIKHNQELLTFMEHPEIEPTNNEAERQLRPNVILRKLTFGNRSETGAERHKILMSIIQTARKNNINPLDILISIATKPYNNLQQGLVFTSHKIQ